MDKKGDAPGVAQAAGPDAIRVMVVDDSAVIRGLITRMLETDSAVKVVASETNGQMALDHLERAKPDVVVLDIEMPVMDGMTALPKLLAADKTLKIIMASTLTTRNAGISIQALRAGAADYVPKPSSPREISGGGDFRRELLDKVKNLGMAKKGTLPRPQGAGPATSGGKIYPAGEIRLRKPSAVRPSILAVGSSTGGPNALFAFLGGLKPEFRLPIVITQHIPKTFSAILAEHISRSVGRPCAEGQEGARIEAGNIYLAPGGRHMTVEGLGATRVIRLNEDPPENFCRPAVDPMLRSVAKSYGQHVLTVILTGMGADGMKGGQVVVDGGGAIIAQDEETSVVWGMPGAVATAGLCSAVLPLDQLAGRVMQLAGGGAV